MTTNQLARLSTAQLVSRFVELGLKQGEAADVVNTPLYNRIVLRLSEIGNELKSRGGDQRTALAPLLDHENLQVRFSAATRLMAIMPEEARRHIELIAESKDYPIAGTAGTYLIMLRLQSGQRAE